jgi:hypothetical protein
VDTTRRVLGVPLWSHEGSSRVRQTPVVDPDLIRSLDVGQAAYIYRGGATFVQVKRLVAAPAALAGEAVPPPGAAGAAAAGAGEARPAPADPSPGDGDPRPDRAPLPDVGPLLDEAFGGEPG